MEQNLTSLLKTNVPFVFFLEKLGRFESLVVVIIGIICLTGWQLNLEIATRILPHIIGMNPLTAVGFICAGLVLFLLSHDISPRQYRYVHPFILMLTVMTIFIGFTSVVNLDLDQILYTPKLAGNKIPVTTGLGFLLGGIALLIPRLSLPNPWRKHSWRLAQLLILVTALMSMFGVIGYVYQTFSASFSLLSPMPLSSAMTFTLFCLAYLSIYSPHGVTKILTRNTPSSILASRLILLTLTLPAITGFLSLIGISYYGYDYQTAMALLVIATIILFTLVVWVNTSLLQRVELENLIIKNELEKKNITLAVNAKEVAHKLLKTEEEKDEAYDKLTYREKLFRAVEATD
jgi:hypothetical protein